MADSKYIGLPDNPDKICPICQANVKCEAGYYDKKPVYRCATCGFVIKQSSTVVVTTLVVLGIVGFSIMSCVAGNMVAHGATPTFGATVAP